MTHDNLVLLLGVSSAFDQFPAVITLWMTNSTHELAVFAFLRHNPFTIGLLSEYIKKEEDYDKIELVIGIAKGVLKGQGGGGGPSIPLDGARIIEKYISKSHFCNRRLLCHDDPLSIPLSYSTC